MRCNSVFAASAAALILSLPVSADMYSKSSPVLQVDAKTYHKLIASSNYTSIVEFYAPWCGHCKNLKPAYEKAAKNLQGLAKVAAVDCDDEANKPLCGQMGVQGFPTLKIVRPGKKAGKPTVEDYQGARSAKAIVDAVIEKIPNHIKRVADKGLDEWLADSNSTAKAVLFSDKGTTSALLRAMAIDYLGSISFAQIRDKEKKAVKLFGVAKFPTLVLLPGGDQEGLVYEGDMKKEAMSAFLSKVATPNPDPAPDAPKKAKADKKKFAQPDEGSQKPLSDDAKEEAPTESPAPEDESPSVIEVESADGVEKKCLLPKSQTCILVLLPSDATTSDVTLALKALSEIHKQHSRRGSSFPIYSVPASNPKSSAIRGALAVGGEGHLEIIAVNAKRSWWRRYAADEYSRSSIASWIDAIRMNEGKREKLPASLVAATEQAAKEPTKDEEREPVKVPEPEPEPEPEAETEEAQKTAESVKDEL